MFLSSCVRCLKVTRPFECHSLPYSPATKKKMHVDQNRNAANGESTSHNGPFDANYSKQIISAVGYAIHLNFLTNPFLMKQKKK